MSPDEVFRIQTILIECHQANLGLPDGVLGTKTKAAIENWYSLVFNKEKFEELAKGCSGERRAYAAASIARDGVINTLSDYTSGVAALRAILDACRKRSTEPDTCSGMVATRFKRVNHFIGTAIAVARCNKENGVWTFMNRGPEKEGALAYLIVDIYEKGLTEQDCEIVFAIPSPIN